LFFGEARKATHQPVDSETSYNWASITKTLTAIAILQLRDRGKLSLSDPAVRYVPELRQVHDAFGPIDAITIRELLTHSAGFRNPRGRGLRRCVQLRLATFRTNQMGTGLSNAAVYAYCLQSGHAVELFQSRIRFSRQVIQRLTGDDFEVYVDKNILKPLDMTNSYFDRSPYFLESRVSASYLRAGDKLTEQPFDFDTGITTSNSGLKAPVTDMVKYLRFLIGNPTNSVYDFVLRRSSLEEAWTGVLPVAEPGKPATPYTKGAPLMGLASLCWMLVATATCITMATRRLFLGDAH